MANHAYRAECGCPGCSFMYFAEERYQKYGPPPVIDTFEPIDGDIGRDHDGPLSPYRVWTDHGWWPYFAVAPRKTREDGELELKGLKLAMQEKPHAPCD